MSDEMHDRKLPPAQEQWLDRMLNEAAPVEPSAALRRAVAEIPLRHPRAERADPRGVWPAYVLRFALLTALTALAAGAWLGYEASVLPEIALSDDAADANADEGWEELAELAFADQLDEELEP